MLLADNGFAENGCRDRDVGLPDQLEDLVLQSKAMHLDIRENHRLARPIDHVLSFAQRCAQAFGVASFVDPGGLVMGNAGDEDKVARQFDINRPLEAQGGMKHPIDFLKGSLRIAEDGRSDGQLFEYLLLGIEFADFVMEQRIFFAFLHSRGPADDDHRRFLGEGFGSRIGDLQSADAIGDADRTETSHAGVGVSSKTGALFVASIDSAQFALRKLTIKSEDIIARNPEYMAHAMRVKTLDEVFANRR